MNDIFSKNPDSCFGSYRVWYWRRVYCISGNFQLSDLPWVDRNAILGWNAASNFGGRNLSRDILFDSCRIG